METPELYELIIDIILKRKPYDETIEYLFKNNIIDTNYKNGSLITLSAFYDNINMLKFLKKYYADLTINNEALLIASQNGHFDCIDILYTNDIDIEKIKHTSS